MIRGSGKTAPLQQCRSLVIEFFRGPARRHDQFINCFTGRQKPYCFHMFIGDISF